MEKTNASFMRVQVKPFVIKNSSFLLCNLLLISFGSSSAMAQIAPNAGALQQELDLQRQREAPPAPAPSFGSPKKSEAPSSLPRITVSTFNFEGNTLLSLDKLQEIIRPWVNRPIDFDELQSATAAIENAYSAAGYLASVTVPPQQIKDGQVTIKIVEGKLGKVVVESEGANPRYSPERAKGFFTQSKDGKQFINTKTLERGLLLLNDVPGVSALGAFEAGSEPGTSDFRVSLKDTPLLVGQVALSDYGSTSTGAAQAVANLNFNNISGMGDQAVLNAIQSQGSGYVVAGYNIPVGSDGWKAGVQASYLQYKTVPSWSSTATQGSANTVSAYATYALQRSQSANTNLRFNAEDRNYNNTQSGTTISNYQISAYSAGINGNWANSESSIINYGLTYTYGNLNINDLTQAGQDYTGPGTAGAYSKYSFNLSHFQELSVITNTTWLNSIYGQLANKNLNSSEQIYLGGPYAVRAYPIAQSPGSQGFIYSSELNHRLNANWNIGGFIDIGAVQQYVNLYPGWQGLTNANNQYTLSSTGLTAKFNYQKIIVDAALAYRIGNNPLYTYTGQQLNADNAYKKVQAWVRASIAF
jgi:hemolysin activation/secretion protein